MLAQRRLAPNIVTSWATFGPYITFCISNQPIKCIAMIRDVTIHYLLALVFKLFKEIYDAINL